jgi:hypothetical protein
MPRSNLKNSNAAHTSAVDYYTYTRPVLILFWPIIFIDTIGYRVEAQASVCRLPRLSVYLSVCLPRREQDA